MAYKSLFLRANERAPVGSRSLAGAFSGLQCPVKTSFSLVHGVTPGAADIVFKGDVDFFRAGIELYLQIGTNSFWGIVVNKERSVRVNGGYTTAYKLADNRDRLFDDLVFAQFNILTNDGEFFHIFPIHWEQQRQTIIRAENKTDFKNLVRDPAKVRRIRIDTGDCTRPLSSAELLDWLSSEYNFTWSATPVAEDYLKAARPLNMDWNTGVPVGQCLEDILNFSKLQFTVYGNLHVHISVAGITENPIQWELLTDNEALCNIGAGFEQTNLGHELNTKGRRLILLGSRNKYQFIYPGLPGWNTNWTYWLVFNWYELAILLEATGLTMEHKIKELPEAYHDYGTWQGYSRMEMTIREYVTQIPFRVYVVNMSIALDREFKVMHDDLQEVDKRFSFNPNGSIKFAGEHQEYNWELAGDDPRVNHLNAALFSRFPVSDTLITHSGDLAFVDDPDHTLTSRQFIAWANSRIEMRRNQEDPYDQVQQTVRIDEGVNLDVEEIVHKRLCRKLWKVNLIFSEPRLILGKKYERTLTVNSLPPGNPGNYGSFQEEEDSELPTVFPYEISPDRPYVAISTDREIYRREFGEPSRKGNPVRYRQRESSFNLPNLRRGHVLGQEVFMLMANLNTKTDEQGRIVKDINGQPIQSFSAFTADEIAPSVAAQILRHEAITTAGNITFKGAAGFRPDGLINTVQDEFDVNVGIKETVNFTNNFNHEFNNVLLDARAIERKAADGERELSRRELIRLGKEILKFPQPQRAEPLPAEHGDNHYRSPLRRIQEIGTHETLLAEVTFDDDLQDMVTGEVVILEETA